MNWLERIKTQPHDDRDNCFLPFDSKGASAVWHCSLTSVTIALQNTVILTGDVVVVIIWCCGVCVIVIVSCIERRSPDLVVRNLEFVLQHMHEMLMALTSYEAKDIVANSRKNPLATTAGEA